MANHHLPTLSLSMVLLGAAASSAPSVPAPVVAEPTVQLASVGPIGGAWPASAPASYTASATCPSATAAPLPSAPPTAERVRAEPG
jgi:hypothetical protein